ncbi:hypothetical protein C7M84_010205 [Penaeus vannamei]|uniref:Uncharacterized protein n=1 Tax=Penaeus vannamei TaxID=6689 RepID=A0A423T4M6_PENVA|nr:hypothetical protein C7M84_010205 [Penaeus vannamei]
MLIFLATQLGIATSASSFPPDPVSPVSLASKADHAAPPTLLPTSAGHLFSRFFPPRASEFSSSAQESCREPAPLILSADLRARADTISKIRWEDQSFWGKWPSLFHHSTTSVPYSFARAPWEPPAPERKSTALFGQRDLIDERDEMLSLIIILRFLLTFSHFHGPFHPFLSTSCPPPPPVPSSPLSSPPPPPCLLPPSISLLFPHHLASLRSSPLFFFSRPLPIPRSSTLSPSLPLLHTNLSPLPPFLPHSLLPPPYLFCLPHHRLLSLLPLLSHPYPPPLSPSIYLPITPLTSFHPPPLLYAPSPPPTPASLPHPPPSLPPFPPFPPSPLLPSLLPSLPSSPDAYPTLRDRRRGRRGSLLVLPEDGRLEEIAAFFCLRIIASGFLPSRGAACVKEGAWYGRPSVTKTVYLGAGSSSLGFALSGTTCNLQTWQLKPPAVLPESRLTSCEFCLSGACRVFFSFLSIFSSPIPSSFRDSPLNLHHSTPFFAISPFSQTTPTTTAELSCASAASAYISLVLDETLNA